MLVRLLVDVDMFSVFPYYWFEKGKKNNILKFSAMILI